MMSMLNQAAVEALCSATYLENYLDCMENLPDDLQRVVSQLRELDSATNDIMTDIAHHQEIYLHEGDGSKKQRALLQIQRGLIKSQEIGDEKLSLVGLIIEHIENRTRQLEQDLENLDPSLGEAREDKEKKSEAKQHRPAPTMLPSPPLPVNIPPVAAPVSPNIPLTTASIQTSTAAKATAAVAAAQSAAVAAVAASTASSTAAVESKSESASNKQRRQRRQRTAEATTKEEEKQKEEEEKMQPKKKKKRKAKKTGDKSFEKTLVGEPIDPDEPTYCLCEQVSYGDMIGCDNDACAIEWFHFNCVGLTNKPKGKWYCPKCRGDKASVKRADLK